MKVDQLTGLDLAEWVARAIGHHVCHDMAGHSWVSGQQYVKEATGTGGPLGVIVGDITGAGAPAWRPDLDWSIGGPVVDRLMASGYWQIEPGDPEHGTVCVINYHMTASHNRRDEIGYDPIGDHHMPDAEFFAPTLLVAACRALVFSVYGDEVPDSVRHE